MVHAYEDASATAFETLTYAYPSQGSSWQPHAATAITGGVNTPDVDYTYDDAGRMVERDFDGTGSTADDQTLVWDAMSNLVELDADGDLWRFIYDASGQRVAKILTPPTTPAKAWAYFGATEVHDPNVLNADDATGTRFYSHGGASVALRQGTDLFLLLGDVQGSADVMVPLAVDSNDLDDGLAAITSTEAAAAKRNSYTPYGAVRGGADTIQDAGVERGWLNQVADTDLGLTYLNARYYDQAIGRFLSPDPLMNPADPRTLDPYRYADNNPVAFQDASGLCTGLSATQYEMCVGGGGGNKAPEKDSRRVSDLRCANRSHPQCSNSAGQPGRDAGGRGNWSPLELAIAWLVPDGSEESGATSTFSDGDRLVESLKVHDHYTKAVPTWLSAADRNSPLHVGDRFEGTWKNGLNYTHGEGNEWYEQLWLATQDIGAVLVGYKGGYVNEATGFLGSHSVDVEVIEVERRAAGGAEVVTATVRIEASNLTSVESLWGYTGPADKHAQDAHDWIWTYYETGAPGADETQVLSFTMTYEFTGG